MKKIFLHFLGYASLACLILLGCQEPPQRNCENFKIGKFRFTSIIDGDTLTTTFERKNDIEVEFFKGTQDTSEIRWINDCEYILKKINPKNRAEEKSVHIKILTTNNSSYTFEFSAGDEPKKLRGTAFKIH